MPATATKLFGDVAHLATTTVGSQLQILEYNRLFVPPRPRDRQEDTARAASEAVRRSALFLELTLVSVCAQEALAETGAETFDASGKDLEYFSTRVGELAGLDPAAVVKQADAAGLLKGLPPPPAEMRMPPLSETVRAARTVIESCPIARLEMLANAQGLEAWGHRCRVAFEALRAFILRHDPREQDRLVIVGREYQRGALSLDEVAALLHADRMDSVVLLEQFGYVRSIDNTRMGEQERLARYSRIREDRLNRAGKFEPTPEQVARDVIASERIEGVDARLWIRPDVD